MQSHSFEAKSKWSLVRLSNEVLSNLVPQGATKLPEVNVEDAKKNLGLKPGPQVHGSNQAGQQIFFSDLQLRHLEVLRSLMSYNNA